MLNLPEFYKTTASDITQKTLPDNSFAVSTDSEQLYVQIDGSRISLADLVYVNTEAELPIAPLPKLYVIRSDQKIVIYLNGSWMPVGSGSGTSLTTVFADTSTTITPNTKVVCLVSGITLTIDETDAVDGDVIEIFCQTQPVTITGVKINDDVNEPLVINANYSGLTLSYQESTGIWRISNMSVSQGAVGAPGPSIEYNPTVSPTYIHPVYGPIVKLDSDSNAMEFYDNLDEVAKIRLRVVCPDPTITGNVVLVPIINHVAGTPVTVYAGSTPAWQEITIGPVNGMLRLVRDTGHVDDTLNDTEGDDVSMFITKIEVYHA